jgi:hypothetical protein
MTHPRPRAPRIAASLRERRNDFRPLAPWPERLLGALGAHTSFADAVLGDLAEERALRTEQQGHVRAQLRYAHEAARAVPHLLWNAVRHGGSSGRLRVAGLLGGLAAVPTLALALLLRDAPPATLVFEGQRGTDMENGVVLNTTHPIQLRTHVLDAQGHQLPPSTAQYRWVAGVPMDVTSNGIVTCREYGDAEVRASAGHVATRLVVRCRPVTQVSGDMVMSLVAGSAGADIPFTARAPSGRVEELVAFEARVRDTSVAALQGLHVRPVAAGATVVTVSIGDARANVWVKVYEPVSTLAGLRPDQRLVSAPVQLAVGDSIQWPLPLGELWLRFTPASRSQPAPRIVVHGQVACIPAFGPTDQARCRVRAPGAWVRITRPRTARGEITGRLALERLDP